MNYNKTYPFELEPLPYPYNALEPYIDEETLHYHHDKHLKTYIDNLNKAIKPYEYLHSKTLLELITETSELPPEIRTAVKNNGGGVFNHELYFNSMRPAQENNIPTGKLAEAIDDNFGGYENFKKKLSDAAISIFGSGYGWLVCTPEGALEIYSSANQDIPFENNLYPILPIDVWEHAYYLKYKNRRGDYADNWFNLIDWEWLDKNFTLKTEH